MTSSIADLISALPDGDGWGPPVTTETTLDGVPYAPFSKGDKLGRMADWTSDGKDGRDGRGGRAQYNRNYRGACAKAFSIQDYLVAHLSLRGSHEADLMPFLPYIQTNRHTAQPVPPSLPPPQSSKTKPPSPSSLMSATRARHASAVAPYSPVAVASAVVPEETLVAAAKPSTAQEAVAVPVATTPDEEGARTRVAVVQAVADDLAGRTTTSRSATATLASTFVPTGSCLRRLTTTAWAS